jgi:plastocyanin
MKQLVALLTFALACTALVACGGGDNADATSAAGGGESRSIVEFEADPGGELAYTSDSETAESGEVILEFKNPQKGVGHDVAIEDSKGETVDKTAVIGEGETSAEVNYLGEGEYTFYCSIPGHREAGMEGTLSVE